MLVSIAAGVYRWWQSGPGQLRRGGNGGGGGGAGRKAPIGGPRSPSPLRAASTPEPERELVGAVASASIATAVAAPSDGSWVDPLDGGGCPISHPVKVNETSGIFHVPGGRFYDRTVAGRCYASADDAIADGFRAAKA